MDNSWLGDLKPRIVNPYLRLLKRLADQDQIDMAAISDPERRILEQIQYETDKLSALVILSMKNGISLQELANYLNWRQFEQIIAFILLQDGWQVLQNYRYFGEGSPSERKRYEIDIVASKSPYILLIDCKHYHTPSQSPMREAAEEQKERAYVFFEQLPIIHESLNIDFLKAEHSSKIVPMVLTWREHQIRMHDSVVICPANSFQDLVVNFDTYISELDIFYLEWEGY